MISGILRQPMAILSAIGLLSLAEDLLQWQGQFQTWIDAWQAFSRPVAMFLFGWMIDLSPWELPDWTIDYIVMGFFVSCFVIRAFIFSVPFPNSFELFYKGILAVIPNMLLFSLFCIFVWPGYIVFFGLHHFFGEQEYFKQKMTMLFFESFIWATLLIAINYAWIASG